MQGSESARSRKTRINLGISIRYLWKVWESRCEKEQCEPDRRVRITVGFLSNGEDKVSYGEDKVEKQAISIGSATSEATNWHSCSRSRIMTAKCASSLSRTSFKPPSAVLVRSRNVAAGSSDDGEWRT